MFEFSAEKFLLVMVVVVLVIGPSRLPGYAAKLANLVRELRRLASGAQEELKEQLGPDFQDIDWRKLDPRQYDPRRIIRDALTDDGPAPVPATTVPPAPAPPVREVPAPPVREVPVSTLAPGTPAPFDSDAT
ncbi:twin-arginine translocase TatA/TatE family subunit [Pseudarthrobacter sp. P1]|uniref:twin-arginine translocase TatA/TatE family subunit n=1 Tax=Pseudarthrobacter sp. P1 TaxID=3418418 RepID=UPI003CEB6BAA